jgi:hypothetical protein
MFVESSSSSGSGRDSREPEPVLCAPRPRRAQVHPCSADLILGPPPFLLNSSGNTKKVRLPTRRIKNQNNQPCIRCCMDLSLTKICSFLSQQREGKSKTAEHDEEDEGGWSLFGGSPPARADNPLVHDPHFLLNQRHHHAAAVAASDISLAVFDSHRNNHHVPTYSNSTSHSSSFAPSYAPAVRIQGFEVSSCRSSHGSNGGGRVLSARA